MLKSRMVHFTLQQFIELKPDLEKFLAARPVDILLRVPGELVLHNLEIYKVFDHERIGAAYGYGNAPNSAVATLDIEYRVKEQLGDESLAVYGVIFLNPDFTFVVSYMFEEYGPLYVYLRKAFADFLKEYKMK